MFDMNRVLSKFALINNNRILFFKYANIIFLFQTCHQIYINAGSVQPFTFCNYDALIGYLPSVSEK